jgi:polyhydroxybutyrate depolymerase
MCDTLPQDTVHRYQEAYNTTGHEHFLEVGGKRRRYLLYEAAGGLKSSSVWILAPGTNSPAEQILAISGLHRFSEEHNFTLVVLEGADCTFNVQLKSQASEGEANDVAYTMKVLQEIAQHATPDMSRIGCVGYSNGARFCCRLASELSNIITGIASVSGIRYPRPNNATLPVPVLAFHGVKDPINPFWGRGDPSYWHTSVPDAVQGWANFNGCKAKAYKQIDSEVSTEEYFECDQDADVALLRVEPGGHTWPGSNYDFADFGLNFGISAKLQANKVIHDFFEKHPRTTCHTANESEACFHDVTWAREQGWHLRPDWYHGLTNESSFEAFQQVLHTTVRANCPRPCAARSVAHNTNLAQELSGVLQDTQLMAVIAGCVLLLLAAVVALMANWSESRSWLRRGYPSRLEQEVEPTQGRDAPTDAPLEAPIISDAPQ